MSAADPELRLSAQRALLGAIYPELRMVKVRRDGNRIILSAVCDPPLSDLAHDALTTAGSEIVSDFPMCIVDEQITENPDPLPREDVLAEGWVFLRAGAQVG